MGRECKILFVEDEETDVLIFKRSLKKEGLDLTIHVANDGGEALCILRGTKDEEPLPKPYLIVTDLKMPGLSGLELIERIREDHDLKDTVIFVLSSSDLSQDIDSAYDHNISGYVTKDPEGHNIRSFVHLLSRYCETVKLPS